jgi:hypothetical protein
MTNEQHDAWHEIQDIKQWLADNDYKVNKYVLGEYTDASQAWIDYKAERAAKIARHNQLLALLV